MRFIRSYRTSTTPLNPQSPAPEGSSKQRSQAVAEFGTSSREIAACRICGRTLLMGERSVGCFTVSGEGPLEVCELCLPRVSSFGLSTVPHPPEDLKVQRKRSLFARRPRSKSPAAIPAASAPAGAAAIPLALAAFNASDHVRILAGLFKTLGSPRASVIPRSPTDREVIVTAAWEIVWYQFRIPPDGNIVFERGTYLSDLPVRWQQWNCHVTDSGSIAGPDPEAYARPIGQETRGVVTP